MNKNKKRIQRKVHVVKGDNVVVISGVYKGKTGVIQKVYLDKRKALVINEGGDEKDKINLITKHVKPDAQNTKGSIVKQEAPIFISKLKVIPKGETEPTRIGRKKNKEGKIVRYSKKTNEILK